MSIAQATLVERTNQLQTLQRELDSRRLNQDNVDESTRRLTEEKVRLEAKAETQAERLEKGRESL